MAPFIILLLLFWTLPTSAYSQNSQKPKLIRDTDTAEGREIEDEKQPKELNPLLAKKNVEIGDFYYKKKNYDAAIQRYIEALEYEPGSIPAYEALARAYEKNEELDKAMGTYEDFIEKFPDSPKISDFLSKLSKLKKKSTD
jgi:outer membrane protein assembly factor BamD (BamD/ComL family)